MRKLNEEEGLTVLVVEQDARIALDASTRAYVLEVGRVALTGTSASCATTNRFDGATSAIDVASGDIVHVPGGCRAAPCVVLRSRPYQLIWTLHCRPRLARLSLARNMAMPPEETLMLAAAFTDFMQQVVSGLASGGIYALLALALVIIDRSTGVINFAQGEMATLST